jgi:hypothetical protein
MVNVEQHISSIFEKQSCWMIKPLAAKLDYSIRSVQRFLTAVGYYRSFTHNGGWYTLRSIPKFDRDGLWFYNDIGFSRAGNMTDTLVELTCKSLQGITAEELGEKLHCRCHSVLVRLIRDAKLQRLKRGRSNIYIAKDADITVIQQKATTVPNVKLPAEIAVLVLVQFINEPGLSFVQLAKSISQSSKVAVSAAQIETLFSRLGVKKTLPM